MQDDPQGVAARLATVRRDIARAAADIGRAAKDVRLVCVSKTFGEEAIAPTLAAGQRIFGENRVQEAMAKWPALRQGWPGLELHLIGPLQTNKAADAVALFDAIETIDRPRIAAAVAQEMRKQGRRLKLFAQINTGDEPQKAGVSPQAADEFIRHCQEELGLGLSGLMCIPPVGEQASPHFALLASIAKRHGLAELSMGMSADFALAIQLGATYVRVGSAIFGGRQPSTAAL